QLLTGGGAPIEAREWQVRARSLGGHFHDSVYGHRSRTVRDAAVGTFVQVIPHPRLRPARSILDVRIVFFVGCRGAAVVRRPGLPIEERRGLSARPAIGTLVGDVVEPDPQRSGRTAE